MERANIVVIGAGIIGASVAYHLTNAGIEGVVVVDKGDLEENDGSTSHAPGGLRTLTGSHFFTTLGAASRAVYDQLPLAVPGEEQFWRTGLVSVATTSQRLDSHRRLAEMGMAEGLEADVLLPDDVAARLPLVDPSTIAGGIWIPSSGVVKTSALANAMRQITEATGRARFFGHSEVIDIEVADGRIVAVVTDGEPGRIECDQAVVCTNIWAPILAERTGTVMPLFPGEHQYIHTTEVPSLANYGDDFVSLPVTTFDDLSLYFRQHGDHLGIGSYDHPARLVNPHELPRTAKMPFTPEDFSSAWAKMQNHMPVLHDAGIADGFNGMFSFTVDNHPIMGETTVKGLWASVGAWLSFASEVGAVMARWMTTGDPGMDITPADINRFHPHQSNRQFLSSQSKYFYEIGFEDLHPSAVASAVRGLRHAPYHHRLETLAASFVPIAGQETPLYYGVNESLVAKHRDRIPDRAGYDATGWTPIMGAEHLELRANVGLVDWSAAIGPIEVSGPGALEHLQHLCTSDIDLPVGGIAYTLVLTHGGGVARDITVARMSTDSWWLLTGKGNLPAEMAYFRSLGPTDGSITYQDLSEKQLAIGIWGPNSREVLAATTAHDLSTAAFPWYTWQAVDVGMAPVISLRISYLGELGYEIYVPPSLALHVWDTLWEAGRAFDMPAVGIQAVMSSRIEKGYRLWGSDMTPEFSPSEAGVTWAMDSSKDFHGKDAAARRPTEMRLVMLEMNDPSSVVYGWEPVLVNDRVVGRVAGGEYGYSVGAFLAHAFVDPGIEVGAAVEVQRTGVRHGATVTRGPSLDPQNERLKG